MCQLWALHVVTKRQFFYFILLQTYIITFFEVFFRGAVGVFWCAGEMAQVGAVSPPLTVIMGGQSPCRLVVQKGFFQTISACPATNAHSRGNASGFGVNFAHPTQIWEKLTFCQIDGRGI